VRQVIATREATMAHLDYSAFGPSVAPAMQLAGVTNCVWVPMIGDGEVFAILAVAGRQNGLVRPSTVEHLKAVAAMAVLARAKVALHDALGNLARTDPLTGTANRRALNERISQLPRVPFAFVAIDVDGLKPVNDTHGHAAGDELLAAVAARMQAELRSADVLARTGGDEFVVLMVGSDGTGASELAARLKGSVSRLVLPWGSPSISVGSAAGAAGAEPTPVAEKADEALYAAKQLRHRSKALSVPITAGSR
jgi:diguanylate cyclase (GGDEF)-like protein